MDNLQSNETLLYILKNSKILYIEDEKSIQVQIEKTLKFFTDNVVCVSNFNDALKSFVTNQPDIVISDIRLPGKTGIDIANEIRKVNKKIPIILLTAHTDQQYLLEAIKLKLVNYLRKPINFNELSNALKEAAKEILENGGFIVQFENNITYDVLKNIVTKNDEEIKLTAKETRLLAILLENKKRRISAEEIKQYVWTDEYPSDGAFKSILSKLRGKIGKDSINNLSNIGYILVTM